jgi:hypothetical protein
MSERLITLQITFDITTDDARTTIDATLTPLSDGPDRTAWKEDDSPFPVTPDEFEASWARANVAMQTLTDPPITYRLEIRADGKPFSHENWESADGSLRPAGAEEVRNRLHALIDGILVGLDHDLQAICLNSGPCQRRRYRRPRRPRR